MRGTPVSEGSSYLEHSGIQPVPQSCSSSYHYGQLPAACYQSRGRDIHEGTFSFIHEVHTPTGLSCIVIRMVICSSTLIAPRSVRPTQPPTLASYWWQGDLGDW